METGDNLIPDTFMPAFGSLVESIFGKQLCLSVRYNRCGVVIRFCSCDGAIIVFLAFWVIFLDTCNASYDTQ